jgi:hypothetical protein
MARYTGPKNRICRKFGEPILGSGKNLQKKSAPPGMHGASKKRKAASEYSIQLKEKQKAKKRIYYTINKEKILAQTKSNYEENREERMGRMRRYNRANKEKAALYTKSYYEKNKERLKNMFENIKTIY